MMHALCFFFFAFCKGAECFTNSNCSGDRVPANNTKDCCVGTSNGLSFSNGDKCTQCIGNGYNFISIDENVLHVYVL